MERSALALLVITAFAACVDNPVTDTKTDCLFTRYTSETTADPGKVTSVELIHDEANNTISSYFVDIKDGNRDTTNFVTWEYQGNKLVRITVKGKDRTSIDQYVYQGDLLSKITSLHPQTGAYYDREVFTYDGAGNLVSKTTYTSNGGRRDSTVFWGFNNKLPEFSERFLEGKDVTPSSMKFRYVYNNGNRTETYIWSEKISQWQILEKDKFDESKLSSDYIIAQQLKNPELMTPFYSDRNQILRSEWYGFHPCVGAKSDTTSLQVITEYSANYNSSNQPLKIIETETSICSGKSTVRTSTYGYSKCK